MAQLTNNTDLILYVSIISFIILNVISVYILFRKKEQKPEIHNNEQIIMDKSRVLNILYLLLPNILIGFIFLCLSYL
jgi:heme/copper-type cytochrome/quinol oxidase subunit 2